MRYHLAFGLALAAFSLTLFTPVAGAQGFSLDDFSLTPEPHNDSPDSSRQTLDKIVAVVGEDVILESELESAIDRIQARAPARVQRMPRNLLRSQVLDQLIMTHLQVERAKQHGIEVSDQDVDQGLARVAQQNHMSMSQFTRAVAADGMDMSQLREQIRHEILVSKLRRKEVMSKVVVTDDDIDRYLENQSLRVSEDRDYRVRQILVPVAAGADAATVRAAHDQIEALREKIVAGKVDFAEAAETGSRGSHAAEGGDLGWISGSDLPRLFEDVLPGMQPGDLSEIFQGDGGFHLIKLEDLRGGAGLSAGRKVMVHEVKARHILLKPNEIRDDQRTRKLARQILTRLGAGDDFAALAREYSDDSATANQGGELGWVQPDQFDPATQRHLAALDSGDVSSIFQTDGGYEILKVENRRERDQTREAIRHRARMALGQQKSKEEGELWLRKLRDEAYVDIRMQGYQSTSGS